LLRRTIIPQCGEIDRGGLERRNACLGVLDELPDGAPFALLQRVRLDAVSRLSQTMSADGPDVNCHRPEQSRTQNPEPRAPRQEHRPRPRGLTV
jgi:hypothetical protein